MEKGLDYAWYRYYSSTWGRFTTADPYVMSGGLGNPQGWNRYAYVAGDPVNQIDPSGLASCNVSGSWTDNSEMYNPMTNVQVWCTTISGGQNFTIVFTLSGYPSAGYIKQVMDDFGREVDRFEADLFTFLLSASVTRITRALGRADCASQFKNAQETINKAGTIGFNYNNVMRAHMKDGKITVPRRAPGVAIYNPFNESINLNSTFNWANPNGSFWSVDGSTSPMGDILGTQARLIGESGMSAEQFMDLTVLHELTHYNGVKANENIDNNSSIERRLWENCIK